MITSLPDDIIVDILARVPRCNYPVLSLVSKHFRSLVESPEIYSRRSLLGCTETCLYGYLYNMDTEKDGFYIANSNNRFFLIPSLRDMPFVRCLVAVGSRIYVFGKDTMSFAIDCRFHTVQPLPRMPIPMELIVVDVIDEKIYVIGRTFDEELEIVVVVFNTETQMWEPEVVKTENYLGYYPYCNSVVVAGKMYMRSFLNSFVYEPKGNKWETDEMLNSKYWLLACVIDDVMYYYDSENKLRAYDTKNRCCSLVEGVEYFREGTTPYCLNMVNYRGKLVLFTPIKQESKRPREHFFMEIAIERRQGGEIWGKVEGRDVLLEGNMIIIKPLVVMV